LSPAERRRRPRRPATFGQIRPAGEGKNARSEEPHELGSVLEGLLGGRPWVAGMSLGELGRHWGSVVGERLVEESSPVALEGGVLVIRSSTAAWGAQLRFLADQVRERANEVLGGALIREVKVTVDPSPAGS
jgi:predicted nucleic acid-binding Zn ribbon protein